MEYLFESRAQLEKELSGKYLAVFLDFDGTIAPIADAPGMAELPAETRESLARLIKSPRCGLAIVSGRELGDLKKRVGLEGLIYVGNHGLEIEGPKIKFKSHVPAVFTANLRRIRDELGAKLSGIKGVFLEDKGLSLSLHYRLADKSSARLIRDIFDAAARPYLLKRKIQVKPGKKVFEIRPPLEWDKGKAVLWLLARQQFIRGEQSLVPVYLGDDVTDEDAFRALKGKGVTVSVGPAQDSSARYYLKSHQEVGEFLRLVLKLQEPQAKCRS